MVAAAHCVSPVIIGNDPQIDLLPGTTLVLPPGSVISSWTVNPSWNADNPQGCIRHTTQTLSAICGLAPSTLSASVRGVGYSSNTN